MTDHSQNVLQGEVSEIAGVGLCGLLSTAVGLAMRPALARYGQHVQGAPLLAMLRTGCCAAGFDWLMHLLAEYPGHTIEFSAFRQPVGTIRGMRTVFWEVRNY